MARASTKNYQHLLEAYDFSPFCTSHSSRIGSSDTNLHVLAENVKWIEGRDVLLLVLQEKKFHRVWLRWALCLKTK